MSGKSRNPEKAKAHSLKGGMIMIYPSQPQYQYAQMPPYAQRIAQMEQQYPQLMQPPQQAPQPIPQISQPAQQQMVNARMVTSKEEALGVPVDFSGALMVFTDVSHGKIYTKAFNIGTGSADIHTYNLDKASEPTTTVSLSPEDYVTRKEYNDLIEIITGGKSNDTESTTNSSKSTSKKEPTNGSGSGSSSKNA